MEQRDDRADRERQLKPERDVNQDPENTEAERPERISRQLAADQRADALLALHFEFPLGMCSLIALLTCLARVNRAADRDEVAIPLARLLNRFVIEMNRFPAPRESVAHLHASCVALSESRSPPLKSTPKLRSPRTTKAVAPAMIKASEHIAARNPLPRKLICLDEIRCSIEMRFTLPVSTNQPKRFRPTISAVKSEARMPSVSEIAKPLTGPLAFQKRIAAVIRVVTLASRMEQNAFS